MKKIVLVSLLFACLPYLSWAQSANDDLYFIPKKKTEKKATTQTVNDVVPHRNVTNVYASPGSSVVVRDASGATRDVDEYNRRYTSRDNTFTKSNDTLYIDEKPFDERGEWVNGFNGSQDDYEYAMRIVRFRNPRFAIPVSSPFYWDLMYSLPSWEWNVYDDGFYAYAFPTFSNRFWWNWRWDYTYGGLGCGSPWRYNWYGPSFYGCYTYRPYYGWNRPGWGPYYGWGGHNGFYGHSYRNSVISRNRYTGGRDTNYRQNNSYIRGARTVQSGVRSISGSDRGIRYEQIGGTRGNSGSRPSYGGREVHVNNGTSSSVRPVREVIRNRGKIVNTRTPSSERPAYTRPSSVNGVSSSYNRPSSTRSSVSNVGAAERGAYRSSSRNSYRREENSPSSRSSSYSSGFSGSSRSRGFSTGGGSSSRGSSSSGSGVRGRVR